MTKKLSERLRKIIGMPERDRLQWHVDDLESIANDLETFESRLVEAEDHVSELGSIKDRISEGIKFVECQEVASEIDSWQYEHYNILKGQSILASKGEIKK